MPLNLFSNIELICCDFIFRFPKTLYNLEIVFVLNISAICFELFIVENLFLDNMDTLLIYVLVMKTASVA